MAKPKLPERMRWVIDAKENPRRRFKELEAATGISADSWKSVWHDRQRPTSEMLEAVARAYPQYAFWLMTGITDPDYGHIAPRAYDGFVVVKGREQKGTTDEFMYLIQRLEAEPSEDEQRAAVRQRIEDEVFRLRKQNIIPGTYVNYEQAMRGYDEPGRPDFYLLEIDPELRKIRAARRREIEKARADALQWRENVAKNQKAEEAIRTIREMLSTQLNKLIGRAWS